jgi:hypothetical protein
MMPLHHGSDPRERKGDPVNAVAVMYVNEHLESLRAEAQQRRVASLGERHSLRELIASSASGLRRILGHGTSGPAVPTLKNYPYGG